MATLEFDLAAGTAQWNAGGPVTVPYLIDPDGLNGVPEYAGTSLGDAVLHGDRFRVFTMGSSTHYGRLGM